MHPEFDYDQMIGDFFANASAASPPAVYFAKTSPVIRPLAKLPAIPLDTAVKPRYDNTTRGQTLSTIGLSGRYERLPGKADFSEIP